MARYYVYRGLVAPAVFLSSIPVALVNVTAAELMWTLTFIVPFAMGRQLARREARDGG